MTSHLITFQNHHWAFRGRIDVIGSSGDFANYCYYLREVHKIVAIIISQLAICKITTIIFSKYGFTNTSYCLSRWYWKLLLLYLVIVCRLLLLSLTIVCAQNRISIIIFSNDCANYRMFLLFLEAVCKTNVMVFCKLLLLSIVVILQIVVIDFSGGLQKHRYCL